VIAPDLPGHGFSTPLPGGRPGMSRMAAALAALLDALGVAPALIVGHSAGAALAIRLALDGRAPKSIVSVNGALLPWDGIPGAAFAPLARLLSALPFVPHAFSRRAQRSGAVERLIGSTGSTLDAEGIRLYARLLSSPGHVAGALAMMANWELDALVRDLPGLRTPLLLVVGDRDLAVRPAIAARVAARLPAARTRTLAGFGHLVHEEAPVPVLELIVAEARAVGVAWRG
jgi:magnesium chelatase accessory protein